VRQGSVSLSNWSEMAVMSARVQTGLRLRGPVSLRLLAHRQCGSPTWRGLAELRSSAIGAVRGLGVRMCCPLVSTSSTSVVGFNPT
jgi:hypothetical protein